VAAGSDGRTHTCSGRAVPAALPHAARAARVVVTRRLMIGSFELKFDHLNMNSTV
jgi:hypothetical protein